MPSGWYSLWPYHIWLTYGQCRMSSGWLVMLPYVIRLRLLIGSLGHPDALAIPSISSRWLKAYALSHPDDLAGVGITSEWFTANSVCHSGDILFYLMSSGRLNWSWYLIRMSYSNVNMSSGWDTRTFWRHHDFGFPQHALTTTELVFQRKLRFCVYPLTWKPQLRAFPRN